MTKEEIDKIFEGFTVTVINEDSLELIERLAKLRKLQEETKQLQRINPETGQLFVGNTEL